MNRSNVVRRCLYLLLLVVVVATSFLVGNLASNRSSAKAEVLLEGSATTGQAYCTILNVSAFPNRIHVKCQANTGGIGGTILYFSAPTNTVEESRIANRYLALLIEQQALGRAPWIFWDDASTSNPPGCQVGDCRLLTGVFGL